ncbi:MAG: UMP kinase [Planctomycetota bacterium]|nr:UMP kinase [Planctomycetota bacterium]
MVSDGPYKRILLKISGEGFCLPGGFGVDIDAVENIAQLAMRITALGKELAIVVGGGNFLRGSALSKAGIDRSTADYMGMLATIMNAMILQERLNVHEVETRILSALAIHQCAESFIRRRAIRHLEKGRVVILAGGTGNPFFTTDTCAALRAHEIGADVLLKATKVDGVYDKDPKLHSDAVRYNSLTYLDVITRGLQVMDKTAITLAMEHELPIVVFDMNQEGSVEQAVLGKDIGTTISAKAAEELENVE